LILWLILLIIILVQKRKEKEWEEVLGQVWEKLVEKVIRVKVKEVTKRRLDLKVGRPL
jgi:hypothetical protein